MKLRTAGWNYENTSHGIKEKAIRDIAEYYGLQGDDLEKFKQGFESTFELGIEHCTEDIDQMFKDLPGEVDKLFKDVREAFVSGTWLSGFGIPPGSDIALALDTIKTAYEGGSTLKLAWDSIPEPEETKPPDEGAGGGLNW